MNLPNYITMSRIACVPLLIWVLTSRFFNAQNGERELVASGLFIAASITDGIDGYLARRRGQITTMGMLLDPLADKLLVTAAFICLVQIEPRIVPAWIAVVVIGREFLVSGLRSIAASQGFTIEASDWGKFKMVVQIIGVVAALIAHHWAVLDLNRFHLPLLLPVNVIARGAIWFMVAISLYSALDYFVAFWRKIDTRVTRERRRRIFVLSRKGRKGDAPAV
jgi:CDP-diacylglycerol--glycerol-3-phosphate 3-phosphatidyltransferase